MFSPPVAFVVPVDTGCHSGCSLQRQRLSPLRVSLVFGVLLSGGNVTARRLVGVLMPRGAR